jgi:hypothetical protein
LYSEALIVEDKERTSALGFHVQIKHV